MGKQKIKIMRNFSFSLLISFVALCLFACSKHEMGENSDGGGGNNNPTHYSLSISPTRVELPASAGSFTISVRSNQAWTASVNNGSVTGLRISNYSGYGNGVITVSYDKVASQYYSQTGTIVVVGSESGTEVCTCGRYRYP